MTTRRISAVLVALAMPAAMLAAAPLGEAAPAPAAGPAAPGAAPKAPAKVPTATGYGGAVTTVDPYATRVGLRVLKRGGNAVDAAVATAAALGVTEPYSAGIGGGGYFLVYDAKSGKVRSIDGRETAPKDIPRDAFIDPATGEPYPFTPDLVTSGVSVGTPGTPATWQKALDRWGTWSLAESLAPATRLARKGFRVDDTFRQQTLDNEERFTAFTSTRKLFWRGGDAPRVGSTFRNPDLARTYELLAERGLRPFYDGALAREIVRTARKPPKTKNTDLPVPRGYLRTSDLARYEVRMQKPTRVRYRGHEVFGMRPSSSGGSTVGEALNILKRFDLAGMSRTDALHHYLEASALAFADRGKYVGDPAYTDVPLKRLLDPEYGAERACLLDPAQAMAKPTAAGDVRSYDGECDGAPETAKPAEDTENISTTNLTVADRWGNVVEYTLTIEQTGGSGIVVPGRGFLLNNELTDFSTVWEKSDPNRIQPGKRPRSSMAPTIVLKGGKPYLAVGSPGGSTIITTVLQLLVGRIDLGLGLPQALAMPRAAQRNTANVTAEPAFIEQYGAALEALGHTLVPAGDALTSAAQIGAATGIELRPGGRMIAVSEPERRGGGSAAVVRPRK
ncbi:gamma-glutamyltransferase [Nocardioides dongkuii]|uniref:gamma-glutamyltransferase n=1 Tax=Nocardioides dongkuii TaxID=2760089 RepID=UPI001D0C46E6|nr:gamma-glutamyltransferase [Nocardioides dongkuii]